MDLFGELRALCDSGALQHPYSLRELVQLVKHLHRYPDNVAAVLHNVFSLDLHNAAVAPVLREVLRRRGLALELGGAARVVRARWNALSLAARPVVPPWHWTPLPIDRALLSSPSSSVLPLVRHRPWKWRPEHQSRQLRGRLQGRIERFSELVFSFSLPPRSVAADCARSPRSGAVHVLLSSPVQLLSFAPDFSECGTVDLASHLPYHRTALPGRPRLLVLGGSELLVVCLPLYRILLVVDEPGAFATPVQIPALGDEAGDGGAASVFNEQMFPAQQVLRGGREPVQLAAGPGSSVAAWSAGGRVLCVVELSKLTHRSLTLPFGIERAVSSGEEWLVQPMLSSEVFVVSSEMELVQRFATSARVPLLLASGLGWCSEEDLVLLAAGDNTWQRVALLAESEGARVEQARVLAGAPGLVLVQTDAAMLLVDPAVPAVRPVCREEEAGAGAVVCWCELGDGQVLAVRKSGLVSIYDCNAERLAREEEMWRVVVGLPAKDENSEQEKEEHLQEQEEEDALQMKLGDKVVGGKGKGSNGSGSSAGAGSGVGAGSGAGSGGGEGEGTGGKSGVKRHGDGGERDPRGLEPREVDELQRAMARKGLEEELALIEMGKTDLAEYREIVASVAGEIEQLRNVLLALEARGKGKKREWEWFVC